MPWPSYDPPIAAGFITAQSPLRISSAGVDYTNGTLYAPLGSSLVVACDGGVGEKRWYDASFGGGKVYIGTDSSQQVYQSSGQLFVKGFQSSEEENVFCEDEVLSTVFTALTEGACYAHPNIAAFSLHVIASFTIHSGIVITSASVSSTSITVFWEPPSSVSSSVMQASCCKVEQPDVCSNNNAVRISNGNFSVDGLEEFTNYSCSIAGFSAPFVATTLSDSKCMCCYSLRADFCCIRKSLIPSLPHPSSPPLPSPLPEPSSPPEDVQLVPVNSTSLRLHWGLPLEAERNGIITEYVLECPGIASVQSPVVHPSLQQLLTGLSPFTNYSCRVAATNVNGTGPVSAWVSATTLEGCEFGASHLGQSVHCSD